MPFQSLPWLNIGPDAFLAALDRGTQAGLERARLALAAERPRGGGGGAIRRPSFDPFEQARTAAILSDTKLKEQAAAERSGAKTENERLISIGVSPEEAAAQSGFAEYMRPSSLSSIPWQLMNTGGGEIVRVNRKTGESDIVQEGRPKADPVKVEKLKALRRSAQSLQGKIGNLNYILAQDDIKNELQQQLAEIATLEQELGAGAVASGSDAQSPFAPAPFSPPSTNAPASGFRIISVSP